MDHLTERYFNDQCTDGALEEILTWFQTPEGQSFLRRQMKNDFYRLVENNELPRHGNVPGERLFQRIQKTKEHPSRTRWILQWLASVSVPATVAYPLYQKTVGIYSMAIASHINPNIISITDGCLC